MSFGAIVLIITAVLVFCGLLQRVLDRMRLTDHQALAVIGMMLIGTFLPDIGWGAITVNIGGAVIPLCICGYLLVKAETRKERFRTILGSLASALAVYLLNIMLPAEAEALPLDPIWINGICGGIIAWAIGRSRRGAFVCGIMGVLLADVSNAIITYLQGYQTELHLGSAGFADAAVISGLTAVLLCEVIGETIERFCRKSENRG